MKKSNRSVSRGAERILNT
ncbi:MAG TPA: hypothetical protein LFW20_03860 [Rickettsia endosymbiont of Omalisus fontisbellaquei]|nr:hypothetical protein [Rickettsia endosymbiont of Omalisus fontisbellaquei]